jgi:hypothetical protein
MTGFGIAIVCFLFYVACIFIVIIIPPSHLHKIRPGRVAETRIANASDRVIISLSHFGAIPTGRLDPDTTILGEMIDKICMATGRTWP